MTESPRPELGTDVALEVYKRALIACDGSLVEAVRAYKAFRSTSVTFRAALDENDAGRKYLLNYGYLCRRRTQDRVKFLRFVHDRAVRSVRPAVQVGLRASTRRRIDDWVVGLAHALGADIANHAGFLAALEYVLNGTLCVSGDVMHRAMLPPRYSEHLPRTPAGLPRGTYRLRPSHDRPVAPFGTTKWVTHLVETWCAENRHRRSANLLIPQRAIDVFFCIEHEEDEDPSVRARRNYDERMEGLLQEMRLDEEDLGFTLFD